MINFVVPPSKFLFTSTLSPITNLSYSTAGNRTNGEDQFRALFAVNAGKMWGFGFKFDYLYGRGYYSNQSTSLSRYALWGSYTGEKVSGKSSSISKSSESCRKWRHNKRCIYYTPRYV